MSQEPSKPRGRPPSKTARRKALAAAHEILMEEGFGRLSVEAVSARSGVGKPTIYRNWANASELAMAALMEGHPEAAVRAGGGMGAELERHLSGLVRAFATTRGQQITLALASADPESEMTAAFRNRVILSSREAGRGLIAAAVERGEIAPPEDVETVLDMIYAPVFYRLLVRHRPLEAGFAASLAGRAVRLLRTERAGASPAAPAP